MSKRTNGSSPEELFAKYRQMIFKTAMGILHNEIDAEDVVQAAFLWIINNPEIISELPDNKTAPYLASIAEHMSLNAVKRQKNHPMDNIDDYHELSANVSVEKTALDKITVEKIKQTMNVMTQRDRYILQLRFFEQKTDSEISEIMGISERNVHVYVHRARKRLTEILKKEGFDYDI